jgi:hypothetical protein
MNEKTKEIHEKLTNCNLGEAFRVYVMNPKSNSEYLLCHLMLTDRFKNFEDLLNAVKDCLKGIPVKISEVNDNKITIMPG